MIVRVFVQRHFRNALNMFFCWIPLFFLQITFSKSKKQNLKNEIIRLKFNSLKKIFTNKWK